MLNGGGTGSGEGGKTEEDVHVSVLHIALLAQTRLLNVLLVAWKGWRKGVIQCCETLFVYAAGACSPGGGWMDLVPDPGHGQVSCGEQKWDGNAGGGRHFGTGAEAATGRFGPLQAAEPGIGGF
jgi:hypothetical protein